MRNLWRKLRLTAGQGCLVLALTIAGRCWSPWMLNAYLALIASLHADDAEVLLRSAAKPAFRQPPPPFDGATT